ncbi:hypothetical protein CTRI78_v002647 [Colletotrichum trifolii]|uniref:Uncharacterized protein n=1 Tax=Colletotrichum trifolii TaxID=5466 RepID=A0A4V3HWX8_COLTR|nr:hypothetical protein CTRI78_v002647 [Colletotrichum trifolii]
MQHSKRHVGREIRREARQLPAWAVKRRAAFRPENKAGWLAGWPDFTVDVKSGNGCGDANRGPGQHDVDDEVAQDAAHVQDGTAGSTRGLDLWKWTRGFAETRSDVVA